MKRIDWFKGDKKLAVAVVDFMRCFVWRSEINLKFKAEQEEIETGIAALEKLRGSCLEDNIPMMRTTFEARIAQLDKERKDQIKAEATYAPTEADKTLKKALADFAKGKAGKTAEDAIIDWFNAYNLDVDGSYLVPEILNAAGERGDVKKFVRTEGSCVTSFNGNNCYKMVFMKTYEAMVNAGTIKKQQVPPIMAEKYAPKAKKGNKKA